MKKTLRFALLTAIVSAFSVGGAKAQTAGTSYLDVTQYSSIDDASKTLKNVDKLYSYDATKNVLVVSAYGAYQNTGQKWVTTTASGSTNRSWDAVGDFKGSAYYQASSSKTATTNSNRTYKFAVTKVDKVSVLGGKLSSSKDLTVNVYECTVSNGTLTVGSTVAKTAKTNDNSTTATVSVDGLDPTKIYSVQVNSSQGSNVDFYEIAFYAHAGAVDPSFALKDSKISIGETTQITVAGKQDLDGITLTNVASDNEAVATVDANGVVTAKAVGTANITFGSAAVDGKYNAVTTYTLPIEVIGAQVATPVISPKDGTVFNEDTQEVTITDEDADATIYYTLDGTDPTTESTKYTGPFTINATTTIKAIAAKTGYVTSEIATAKLTYKKIYAKTTVSEATTWDFSKNGVSSDTPVDGEQLLANVDGVKNDATFKSDALTVNGGKVTKSYYQGISIKFTTTVPGTVKVVFSNTGSKDTYRYLKVNGEFTTYKSKDKTDVETKEVAVPAGEVTLSGFEVTNESTMEGKDNGFNWDQVTFTPSAVTEAGTVTIKANFQRTSFSSDKAIDFSKTEGLNAYVVTDANGKVEAVTSVPANTGVIVERAAATAEAQTFTLYEATDAAAPAANFLFAASLPQQPMVQAFTVTVARMALKASISTRVD